MLGSSLRPAPVRGLDRHPLRSRCLDPPASPGRPMAARRKAGKPPLGRRLPDHPVLPGDPGTRGLQPGGLSRQDHTTRWPATTLRKDQQRTTARPGETAARLFPAGKSSLVAEPSAHLPAVAGRPRPAADPLFGTHTHPPWYASDSRSD